MRKLYPYLDNPYSNTTAESRERTNFLSKIDSFVNQKQYVKITLLNWLEEPLKEIAGELTSGSITKDGSSSVRRTCSLSATVNGGEYSVEDGEMDFAINKKIFIEIGIKNYTDEYPEYPILWFPQGVFFISSFSISSSATSTVNIQLSLKDKMAGLNGDVGGVFPATTILDEMNTQTASGAYVSEKVLIYNIIQEVVNHFGGEELNNIVIEDVPLRIKRIMKWTGDNPVYMIPEPGTSAQAGNLWYQVQTSKPSPMPAGTLQVNNGDDAGYIYSDFTWVGELTASAGETVTSVLDKIIQTLGNYEYFYDEFGVFHFREIKNFLNTTQGKVLLDEMEKSEYLVETTTGKSTYTFSDNTNLISITANPQYGNIKNDYIVQGLRKMTGTDISYPIRYHLAIDHKPQVGNSYYNLLLYRDEITNDIQGYFPLWVASESKLPMPGNFNIIYRVGNTQKFVYWDNDVYKPVKVVRYYPPQNTGGTNEGYVTKDWRTEIYLQGLLVKNNGLDAAQYLTKLQTGQLSLSDTTIPTWIKNLYMINRTNNIDINYYFEELEAFWPQIYDLDKQQFIGQEQDPSLQRVSLTDGNFYLDFIEPNTSALGEFSVQNIGRRSDVVVNEDINCLFEPEIPDIVFLNLDDDDFQEKREECQFKGQPFTQVRGDIYWGFATGGYNNGAFDQIKYELYLHTNYQKTLSLTSLPIFYLEPNSRVTIDDTSTNTFGDYIITSFSIPFGPGSVMASSASETFERF